MGIQDSRPIFDSQEENLDLNDQEIEGLIPHRVRNNNIKQMHLTNNHIRKLPKKAKKTKVLELAKNELEEIPQKMIDTIVTYKDLHELDLSDNGLKYIPSEANKLLNLHRLTLSGNKLTTLSLNISKLKEINLSQNCFEEVPIIPSNVRHLTMDFNRITTIGGSFESLTKLSLVLNNIEEISSNIFLPNLEFLDISKNKLAILPNLSFCTPKLRILNCSYNLLIQFPILPDCIREATFRNNEISIVPENFSYFAELRYIELCYNKVQYFPKLPSSISYFSAHNNHIKEMIDGDTPKLRKCYLHNNLLTVPPHFTVSEEISLSRNHLTSIDDFQFLDTITFIDISQNQIETLPEDIFLLPNLKYLIISANKIQKLPNTFSQSNLNKFDMSYNPILDFSIEMPKSITHLYCSFCKLTQLPKNISECTELTELVIMGNNITNIPLIPNLTKLYASDNKLTTFPMLSESIKIIDLAMNEINQIPDELNYQSLIDLDLSHNKLESFPSNINCPELKSLRLSDNINLKQQITKIMFPNLQILDVDETGIIYSVNEIPEVRELMTNQIELFKNYTVKVIKSNLGIGFSEMCGIRDSMEDAIVIRNNIKDGISTFAVFDGHGGCKTSYFAAFRYVKIVSQYVTFDQTFISKCIGRINEVLQKRNYKDGSTAAIVLKKGNKIITAHLGDARIIIIDDEGKIRFQTIDHKPESRFEFERIRDEGSTVVGGRIQGFLGVSRAFGDFSINGISSEPTIQELELEQTDKWILIACDGVFDVVNDYMIQQAAINSENAKKFAMNIRNLAYSAHSADNISVITIDLKYENDNDEENENDDEEVQADDHIWYESTESEFKGETNEMVSHESVISDINGEQICINEETLAEYVSQERFDIIPEDKEGKSKQEESNESEEEAQKSEKEYNESEEEFKECESHIEE
ncbi:protein phosphatase 2C [Histomonas meleagridis]|uniref:protein phosphatase 2C n=1 Tax=Histomonas meleagridis TaxID=135588 RepID=UPI00355A6BA3|nr:protein phosphatase 2C [Histomonas meleagridis]KAH0797027.1 protein phosphatase 2C [Histomonas meleagridis]